MKFTVDQFAEANGVRKPAAYGFLRFCAERGVATTSKANKPEGTRGKPSIVYDIEPHIAAAFGIKEYVAPVQVATETTETQPTETAQVAA